MFEAVDGESQLLYSDCIGRGNDLIFDSRAYILSQQNPREGSVLLCFIYRKHSVTDLSVTDHSVTDLSSRQEPSCLRSCPL